MNALNSNKSSSSTFAPAPASGAASATSFVPTAVLASTQQEVIVKSAVASNTAVPLVKKEQPVVRSIDPHPLSPSPVGAPKQLKAAPPKAVSSSHTVTTSMQFQGYEARCETILKTLVCVVLTVQFPNNLSVLLASFLSSNEDCRYYELETCSSIRSLSYTVYGL